MRARPFVVLALPVSLALVSCGLTARESIVAGLESANAAIVASAQELDVQERAAETSCKTRGSPDVAECLASARKALAVLDAYNTYTQAWSLLKIAWNASKAPESDPAVAAARAKVEQAAANYYASKAALEGGKR